MIERTMIVTALGQLENGQLNAARLVGERGRLMNIGGTWRLPPTIAA